MDRISPDNPVRRRLFTPDPEEASLDNFTNVLQEEDLRVKTEKMKKWNFDFENETPLNGNFQWTRCENDTMDYLGIAKTNDTTDLEGDKEMEVVNEDTIAADGDLEDKVDLDLINQNENETTPDKKNLNAQLRSEESTDRKTGNYSDQNVRRNIF